MKFPRMGHLSNYCEPYHFGHEKVSRPIANPGTGSKSMAQMTAETMSGRKTMATVIGIFNILYYRYPDTEIYH